MLKMRGICGVRTLLGAAALTLGAAGFYFLAPSGYVALDLNPSIEIRTNRLDQVVSVKAVNDDAKELLKGYKLTDHDLEDVLEDMVDLLEDGGYFHNKDKNDILVTVKDGKAADDTVKRVNAFLEDYMERCQLDTRILDQKIDFDEEIRKAAEKYHVSEGKMALIERLLDGDRTLTAGELAGMRISSLLLYAKEHNISLDTLEDRLDEANEYYRYNSLEALEEEIDRMEREDDDREDDDRDDDDRYDDDWDDDREDDDRDDDDRYDDDRYDDDRYDDDWDDDREDDDRDDGDRDDDDRDDDRDDDDRDADHDDHDYDDDRD